MSASAPETPPPAPPGDARRTPVRRTSRISIGNIVRSLGLLLVLVFVVVFFQERGGTGVPAVDPQQTYIGASDRAHYPLRVPRSLPAGWKCTSARDTGGADKTLTLEVGWVTAQQHFAQLVESDVAPATLDGQRLSGGTPSGPAMSIAGRTWTPYPASKSGETAWLTRAAGVTTIVTGNADRSELRTLAASLHPFRRPG